MDNHGPSNVVENTMEIVDYVIDDVKITKRTSIKVQ